MKRYDINISTFLFCALLGVNVIAESQPTSLLTVRISGINQLSGNVQVSLYNSAASWLENSTYKATIAVESNTVVWNIEGLVAGQYAIAGFHDVNLNGECDRNFIGIPTEAFGFSNNVRPKFSAPKWELAKFDFETGTQAVEITLQ